MIDRYLKLKSSVRRTGTQFLLTGIVTLAIAHSHKLTPRLQRRALRLKKV